jgi:hypothetical protein
VKKVTNLRERGNAIIEAKGEKVTKGSETGI